MKFTAEKSKLAAAVSAGARSIATKPSQIAFMALKLSVEDDGFLTVTGTDGETTTVARCPVTEFEPGVVGVPGPMLNDLVRNLPVGSVAFELEDSVLAVTASTGSYKIPTLPELPVVSYEIGDNFISCSGQSLAEAVEAVVFIARSGDGVYGGVKLEKHGTNLRLVSTDRYRLGLGEIEVVGDPKWSIDTLVPSKALQEVSKLFAKSDVVKISSDAGSFSVKDDTTTMITRLNAGKFPAYQSLLDRPKLGSCIVEATALAASIKRVAAFSDGGGNPFSVKLTFKDNSLEVSAGGNGSAKESISIDGDVPESVIYANSAYLIEAINGASSNTVTISPTGESTPLFIDGIFKQLVMPTRN